MSDAVPEAFRDELARYLMGRYRTGHTHGQRWLLELSGYVAALSPDDTRLLQLQSAPSHKRTAEFLMTEGWSDVSGQDPSWWLDRFAAWATDGSELQRPSPMPQRPLDDPDF